MHFFTSPQLLQFRMGFRRISVLALKSSPKAKVKAKYNRFAQTVLWFLRRRLFTLSPGSPFSPFGPCAVHSFIHSFISLLQQMSAVSKLTAVNIIKFYIKSVTNDNKLMSANHLNKQVNAHKRDAKNVLRHSYKPCFLFTRNKQPRPALLT